MTPRHVARLTSEGVFKKIDAKHYDLRQAILSYIDFNKTESRKSSTYEVARAKKVTAEAEIKEIQLQKELGQVIDIELVGQAIEAEYGIIRTRFLGLPSKCALALANIDEPPKVQAFLESAINEILSELTVDQNYVELAAKTNRNPSENSETSDETESD